MSPSSRIGFGFSPIGCSVICYFPVMLTCMFVSFSERRCRLLVGLGWGFAALFSLPMFFIYAVKTVDGVLQC